jgi:hypothetical protein
MLQCSFKLNNKPMSEFKIGALSFPAFSGKDGYTNKPSLMCTAGYGAIPIGRYYIFDRQSGGILGPLKDWLDMNGNIKSEWFTDTPKVSVPGSALKAYAELIVT